MKPTTAISIAILAVVGTLIFVVVRRGTAFFDAINPVNPENVISQGFNEVVQVVSGQPGTSLGSIIFDLFNPDFDPNAPVKVTEEELEFIDFASIPKKRGPVIFTPPTAGV